MEEYNLHEMWKSPNGTIRAHSGRHRIPRTHFSQRHQPLYSHLGETRTLARHAYGDVYRNTEMQVAAGSKAELVVTDAQGNETRALIHPIQGVTASFRDAQS